MTHAPRTRHRDAVHAGPDPLAALDKVLVGLTALCLMWILVVFVLLLGGVTSNGP